MMVGKVLAGLCAPVALVCMAGTSLAAPSPATFGRLPGIQDAAISPDGTRIAYLGGSPKNRVITIATLDSGKEVVAPLGANEVDDLIWIGDKYILITVTSLLKMHYEGSDTRTYHVQHDVVISPDGKMVSNLLSGDDASQHMSALPVIGTMTEPAPTAMVIGLNWHIEAVNEHNTRLKSDQGSLNRALWRVDVATGAGHTVEVGDPHTYSWLVDASGEARVRLDYNYHDQRTTILARPKGQLGWTTLLQQTDAPDVLGYSDPEDSLYLRYDTAAGRRIVRHDLKTGAEQDLATSSPHGSLWMGWNQERKAPLVLATETDGQTTYQWLNPKYGAVYAKLGRAVKGQTIHFISTSKDETRFVITASAHDKPPTWYLFDSARNELSPIGQSYPDLADTALGQTSFFTYRARDGLEIPAYLTLPPGAQPGRRLPLIVFPHGGPAARDYDGEEFDWWAQFMASSGYAVLQPQFRGSAGYGDAFEKAGHHEWGGKMQTDLLDGIDDLAKKGVIDPTRVCIVGASFGGYAALAGATLHPDAYRCAASINGVSDLALLEGQESRTYGETGSFERMVGDAREDKALITSTSPIRNIDAIKAPILIVSSAEDTTVAPEQSHFFYDAAVRQKKPITLVTLEGDDHYLHNSATRTKMLEALSAFLQANLPVTP
jgi:dipeptidyl aminopeptidase/acylaminoacyl peptidase